MGKSSFAIRDPIHGFVELNPHEWNVINSRPFQRLRRIRQLAWTDYVYPAAMHCRFEHSIGVMHVATRIFDAIWQRDQDRLKSEFDLEKSGAPRQRQILRLAALLHDLGHSPFSHAGEEALPQKDSKIKYTHEEYSDAILTISLHDCIDNDGYNYTNHGVKASDISEVFSSRPRNAISSFLKTIVSGQMDADRMDYLLRDSYHCGVTYGRYDLDRIINSCCLCTNPEDDTPSIGIDQGGLQAAEGLIIARYMMFSQVYFHHTRSIYDRHLSNCLSDLLSDEGGHFPPPTKEGIARFLRWDDWRVLGALADGQGGEHGRRIAERDHYRLVHETPEAASAEEIARAEQILGALVNLSPLEVSSEKSWYKKNSTEVLIRKEREGITGRDIPLSQRSGIVGKILPTNQRRVYVAAERRREAYEQIKKLS